MKIVKFMTWFCPRRTVGGGRVMAPGYPAAVNPRAATLVNFVNYNPVKEVA